MPMRPGLSVSIAILYPFPSSPNILSSETSTSSNTTSQVEEARIPSLSSFFPMISPGASFSTTNAVMPLYPASGFALANTRNSPASAALDIHSLLPEILYPLSVFVAVVFIAKASDPAPDSERQKEASVSVANLGRYRFLISSDPHSKNARFINVFWISTITAIAGSTFANSSIVRMESVKLIPTPPYSGGISIPINPSSKSLGRMDESSLASASIW
mmetsp:Transcript_17640/g.31654  ORF Transcript_17640/g.31654 Transcript_17640/m.31654 type:complete len:217 (+) Transcript_17640:570-1220(+)